VSHANAIATKVSCVGSCDLRIAMVPTLTGGSVECAVEPKKKGVECVVKLSLKGI